MARYAIKKNGVCLNAIEADLETAVAIADLYQAQAYLLADGEDPGFPALSAVPRYVLTRFEFLKRIGRANRKQIRASADLDVVDAWDLIKSSDSINVMDDEIIQAIDAIRLAGIITMSRRNQILEPA